MAVKRLSSELIKWKDIIRQKAIDQGLDFFEVIYEMVDYKEINELAAMGGFPQRYPHWRFGMEYDKLSKSYAHGLSKIYEMVINTDPCYAYLLSSNSLMEHKFVMAHVYGHSDFFKNNLFFADTNRRMLDQMANHAVVVRQHMEKHGREVVEEFVDSCLSLDNLLDYRTMGKSFSSKLEDKKLVNDSDKENENPYDKIPPARKYLDKYLYKAAEIEVSLAKSSEVETRHRDVLKFLLENAPLESWQRDVLEIVRKEAYYFAPQGQTKIMNEGWASLWHTKIMTEHILDDSEIINYANVHSGAVAVQPGGLNPYKLGLELFRNIILRWDKGQHGLEWDRCDDEVVKKNWDKQSGEGLSKVFQIRQLYNDLTFVDEYLTEDFCREQKMFLFAFDQNKQERKIQSREFKKVKERLLTQLTNFGQPLIEVIDGNYKNQGALLLEHLWDGRELKQDFAAKTLKNLEAIWGRKVYIKTKDKDSKDIVLPQE